MDGAAPPKKIPKKKAATSKPKAAKSKAKLQPKCPRQPKVPTATITIDCGARRGRGTSNGGAKRANDISARMERVDDLLKSHGVGDLENVSKCLKSGILNQNVKLLPPEDDPDGKFGLDQILATGECFTCNKKLSCRVRDVLYQPDYAGFDYENDGEEATFRCEETEECCGIYITGICYGDPTFDSGKFHNHCTDCAAFGQCIGDYRESHCPRCGEHYYAGAGGIFGCPRCGGGDEAGDCCIM